MSLSPWEEEDPGPVTEAIPCLLLLAVWEGHDLCHGWPAGPSLRWCFQVTLHICQCGAEIIMPLVPQTGWKHGGDHHQPLCSTLLDGNCVCHLSGICWYDYTECSRPSVGMQSEVWQRVHGAWCPWRAWKSSEDSQIEVWQVKKKLPRNHAEWNVTMSSLMPSQSSEWMPTISLNHCEFVFEQAVIQSDEQPHHFHSHSGCNIMVLTSCSHQLFYLTLYI